MQQVQIHGRRGIPINPGEITPMSGWPVRHLNAGTAGTRQLLAAPGNDKSHFVTGYILGGGATGDGFHLLRRNNWGTLAAVGDVSIEFWYKLEATTAAVPNLITRGNEASNGWNIELTTASLIKWSFHDGAGSTITLTGTTAIDDGEWHHIVCVVDRSSATGMQIYVDGVADATAVDPTGNSADVAGGTTVVVTPVNSEVMYMSTIGFYYGSSGLLSAATILSNYNSGIGRKYTGGETGLQCAFNLDEGVGTSAHDVKNDTGNVGTITNQSWTPFKQNAAAAAVSVQGAPFEETTVALDIEPLDAMGKFWTGLESATGVHMNTVVTFPHAIKIGRNNPLRILETDGTADLILFGYTDKY